jgi:hypothetical protein
MTTRRRWENGKVKGLPDEFTPLKYENPALMSELRLLVASIKVNSKWLLFEMLLMLLSQFEVTSIETTQKSISTPLTLVPPFVALLNSLMILSPN